MLENLPSSRPWTGYSSFAHRWNESPQGETIDRRPEKPRIVLRPYKTQRWAIHAPVAENLKPPTCNLVEQVSCLQRQALAQPPVQSTECEDEISWCIDEQCLEQRGHFLLHPRSPMFDLWRTRPIQTSPLLLVILYP